MSPTSELSNHFVPYYLKDSSFSTWLQNKHNSSEELSYKRDYLPSSLNLKERNSLMELNSMGNQLKYVGKEDSDLVVIKTNNSIPGKCGVYYFEMELKNFKDNNILVIGLCTSDIKFNKLPGNELNSYGFHLNDNTLYYSNNKLQTYGTKFVEKDILGCGVNYYTNTIFFTKNGVNLGTAFKDIKKDLLPCIGLKTHGIEVELNFGHHKFKFDIEQYYKEQKNKIWKLINESKINLDEQKEDNNSAISFLICSYLIHHGYISTAYKLVKNCLNIDISQLEEMEDITMKHNIRNKIIAQLKENKQEDIQRRQSIKEYILQGEIEKSIEATKFYYPNVFQNNEMILFQLNCRLFIEMMRELYGLKKYQSIDELNSININNNNNKDNNNNQSIESCLNFCNELYQQYNSSNNPEIKNCLTDLFSLLAYKDLSLCNNKHLLNIESREQLGNKLNSAILVSQGKPAIPHLELIYRQNSTVNQLLVEYDIAEGGFIDIKRDCLD